MTKPSCKATHKGTCQICGAVQLLPAGKLSKHGYTVEWGAFEGVCPGAGRLPFEQSTDAIADAVAKVEADVAATEAEIATLRDINSPANDGTSVWYRHYDNHVWKYIWIKIAIEMQSVVRRAGTPEEYTSVQCAAVGENARFNKRGWLETDLYGEVDVRKHALWLNERYAYQLDKRNNERRRWLRWQAERVASWAPAPLIPRS